MKITLVGRPGTVEKKSGFVAFTMESSRAPALAEGMPEPKGTTRYMIMVGEGHWAKVEEAISANVEDKLIIEGFASVEVGFTGICVSATNVTTRELQGAQRGEQREGQERASS